MTTCSERGAVAVFALTLLALLTVLVGAWLRMVTEQVAGTRLDGTDVQARQLAEAGIERVLAWFADPSSFDGSATVLRPGECSPPANLGTVFLKRCTAADGLPSFVGALGERQFTGTMDDPAVDFSWEEASQLLGGPSESALDPSVPIPSVRTELRIFAPRSPDAVATVVSRATVDDASAAVRVELSAGPWRGLRYAVHTQEPLASSVPTRVHWGEIAIDGAFDATGLLDRLPLRDPLAAVDGHAYANEPGRDRWVGVVASGPILGPVLDGEGFAAPFEHVLPNTVITPIGLWSHEALKQFARRSGRYFATRGTGLLYPDSGEPGVSLGQAMAEASGTGRFLFVDTLNGAPPGDDNLDVLEFNVDHVQAAAYIAANVSIVPGSGRSTLLDSPPSIESPDDDPPAASGLRVEGVHYRGPLVVAGELSLANRFRLVGAVAAFRGVRNAADLEVWYDGSLRRGYQKGIPPVVIKTGSRRSIDLFAPPVNPPSEPARTGS